MQILNISHSKRERSDFHQIIESGFGDDIYLFVHFINPVIVVFDGKECITDSNACIIYTPGKRQEYKSHDGVFLNNFIVFKAKYAEYSQFTAEYPLPQNEIFYITNGDEITHIMEKITYRITNKLFDFSVEIDKYTEKLFETLCKLSVNNNPSKKRTFEIKQRFLAMRNEIAKNPKDWTVAKMAKHVWFTRSRFSVLYREFFAISPSTDLINLKIEYAKNLLKTTKKPISEVSELCGYSSVEHFIGIFGRQVGYTPLQYRKFQK
ncbi:MAG: helix-turn-helix transcriptional regulator [Defluviitaleaceae bacterium]|nr:helix-turn-helix transcriptional regulator [Defluviitaleaceae bacterium]